MKSKIKIFFVVLILFFLSGCNKELLSPTNLAIDHINNAITWDEVEGAQKYIVSANDSLYEAKQNTFSLNNLEVKSYEIKVKAIKNKEESGWSDILTVDLTNLTGLSLKKLPGMDEYEVIGIGGIRSKDLVIPDNYNGLPVTRIAEGAFANYTLIETVRLGKNIKVIGRDAFKNLPMLTSLWLNEGLEKISYGAFQGALSLKELKLPASLKEIGDYAFSYNKSIENVAVPSGIKTINKKAFYEASKLREVTLPENLTDILDSAFARCLSLEKINLPVSLKYIGESAFYETSKLKEITIPSKVKRIEKYAFERTGLTKLQVSEGVLEIGANAFYEARNLEVVSLPTTLTRIEDFAFSETKLLKEATADLYAGNWLLKVSSNKEIIVKDGTIGIAASVIRDDNLITSVMLPKSLKYIGDYNFFKLESINTVNLENTALVEIGEGSFNDVKSLRIDKLPGSLKSVGRYAFYNTENTILAKDYIIIDNWLIGHKMQAIENLLIPDNIIGISDYAFNGFTNVKNINFNNVLKYIGVSAFNGLKKVNSLDIPDSVIAIDRYAFSNMINLLGVKLPKGLVSISQSLFYGDLKLEKIVFPTELEEIGDYAFYENNFKELALPSKLKKIGKAAFYQNVQLREIKLNEGLELIGPYAFSKALKLESLTIPSTVLKISEYAFYSAKELKELNLGRVVEVADYAFYDTNKLASINFGEDLKKIGAYAFSNNEVIEVLVLPRRLEKIGAFAFSGFKRLNQVYIKKNIESIGSCAFEYNDGLTFYMEEYKESLNKAFWNSRYRPLVYGGIFSSDGSYIEALNLTRKIDNLNKYVTITDPERQGYKFLGWSTRKDGEVEFTSEKLSEIALNQIIFPIWEKILIEG